MSCCSLQIAKGFDLQLPNMKPNYYMQRNVLIEHEASHKTSRKKSIKIVKRTWSVRERERERETDRQTETEREREREREREKESEAG